MLPEIRYEKINLIDLDTGQSMILSEKNTTYILDGKPDWGPLEADVKYVGYTNQIGSQKTNTILKPRPINILGWVVARNYKDMKSLKKTLNKFVNPLHMMRCEYDNYYIDFTPDKSVKYSNKYEENNEIMCRFEIEGTCGIPLFSGRQRMKFEQVPSIPIGVFPLVSPLDRGAVFGKAGVGSEREIENKGDTDSYFTVTLTCITDELVRPKITLLESGVFIEVNITMYLNDVLYISTEYGNETVKVTRSSGEVENCMLKVTRDSDLFLLPCGLNTLQVSEASGPIQSVDFTMEFNPLYMEVE